MFSKFRKKKCLFKNFEIYMKDPQSTEMKEKLNFRFCNYHYFWSYCGFCTQNDSKNKNRGMFLLFFPLQPHSTSFIKILKCKLRICRPPPPPTSEWGAGLYISLILTGSNSHPEFIWRKKIVQKWPTFQERCALLWK